MSAILTKFICSVLMSFTGLVVVKNISDSKENIKSIRTFLLMLPLIIIPAITYNIPYTYSLAILNYSVTICTYQQILRISFNKAIIACGILLITLFILDFLGSLILVSFITIEQARNAWYINIVLNAVFILALIIIYNNKLIVMNLSSFIEKIENRKATKVSIATILSITAMSTILFGIGSNFTLNGVFTTNFLLFLIFFFMITTIMGERNNYDKLSDEYDGLISHVRIFEEWIENEQLNRHEFKNQLAVLRGMTKEKKVKDKIDKIISDNINIDNELVNQLKNLPSGGFKGLLYYKIALSRKYKIKFDIDVGNNVEEILNSLNDKQLEVLTKLIGIYTDNAIEAALETKKKLVSVEIYNLDDNINIVVTNSFNTSSDIKNKNMKGISTKGKGRGNGLYFANKLINKNNWLETNQEIIKNLYVERLIIKSK